MVQTFNTMERCFATIVIFATSFSRSFAAEKGPYVTIVHNVTRCTTSPQPWFRYNVTVCPRHGENLLCGAFGIDREIKNPKFNIYVDFIGHGKIFEMKKKTCHRVLVQVVLRFLGLRFNSQKCTLKQTKTEFSDMSMDMFLHTFVQTHEYGQLHFRYEMFTSVTTVPLVCFDLHAALQARKKSNLHP